MTRLFAFLAFAIGLAHPAAADRDPHDHDVAQEAVRRAEAVPLAPLMAVIEARFKARVIDVEFERKSGQYVYEFELITVDGRIIEVVVDAATGQVLRVEGDPDTAPEEDRGDAGAGD